MFGLYSKIVACAVEERRCGCQASSQMCLVYFRSRQHHRDDDIYGGNGIHVRTCPERREAAALSLRICEFVAHAYEWIAAGSVNVILEGMRRPVAKERNTGAEGYFSNVNRLRKGTSC